MPTYSYKCQSCEYNFDIHQSFSEEILVKCPKCKKKKLEKQISGGLGFFTKGGGSSSLGGSYIPMDSAEQKFEERLKELGP